MLVEGVLIHANDVQHVRIAEIRTATQGLLKAALGSCVGLGIINTKTGVCGMAHCLLPIAPANEECTVGRYADQALKNLLREVLPRVRDKGHLRAYLAGGARVMPEIGGGDKRWHVGELNLSAARSAFKEHGLNHTELEIGGTEGCTLVINCNTFEVTSSRIRRVLIKKGVRNAI